MVNSLPVNTELWGILVLSGIDNLLMENNSSWLPMQSRGDAILFHSVRCQYLTIILWNRAEYYLILSRRGRRPSWLNQEIFRKIEKDNCFIIQQIVIDHHFHNKKNFSCMIKRLKLATNNKHKTKISRNQSLLTFTSSTLISKLMLGDDKLKVEKILLPYRE